MRGLLPFDGSGRFLNGSEHTDDVPVLFRYDVMPSCPSLSWSIQVMPAAFHAVGQAPIGDARLSPANAATVGVTSGSPGSGSDTVIVAVLTGIFGPCQMLSGKVWEYASPKNGLHRSGEVAPHGMLSICKVDPCSV